jgi:hypothetical protein
MHRPFAVLLALAALTACSDITYQAPVAWSGTLLPRNDSGVTGSVAAVSQGRTNTEAGLDVVGDANTTYGWQINRGTCASPGAILGGRGAYANVTTNNNGDGTVPTTFISALMPRDEDFHAVIVDSQNRSLILACGDMADVSF